MTVRSLLTARHPVATMDIDRAGICRAIELNHTPSVGNPHIGSHYADLADNPWNARGCERMERSALKAARIQRPIPDHHETLQEDGTLMLHYGVTIPRPGGGFRRGCYEIPVGSAEIRRQLGAEARLIVNLGDAFLGCLVDQTGICWWWPYRLVDTHGGTEPLQVLGFTPPIWRRQTRGRLGAPAHPINAPHVAEEVFLPGEKRAIVSSMPLQGGAFSLWVIDLAPRIWPGAAVMNGHG